MRRISARKLQPVCNWLRAFPGRIPAAFDLWIWRRIFKSALQNLKRKLNSNDSSLNRRNRRNAAAPLFSFYRCLAPGTFVKNIGQICAVLHVRPSEKLVSIELDPAHGHPSLPAVRVQASRLAVCAKPSRSIQAKARYRRDFQRTRGRSQRLHVSSQPGTPNKKAAMVNSGVDASPPSNLDRLN
jgi:hypothetical protein